MQPKKKKQAAHSFSRPLAICFELRFEKWSGVADGIKEPLHVELKGVAGGIKEQVWYVRALQSTSLSMHPRQFLDRQHQEPGFLGAVSSLDPISDEW